jgi:carbon-monoxide dehydrogenase large subunit
VGLGVSPSEGARYIGKAVPRLEDERLVRGEGRYVDDNDVPDALHAWFVRTPYASARITSLDVSSAQAMDGVVAVLTAADYLRDGGRAIAHGPVPADNVDPRRKAFDPAQGHVALDVPQQVIADAVVRHAGEIVAMIVAHSAVQAQDASELVEVGYEQLPLVLDPLAATEPDAPQLWPQASRNICLDAAFGDAGVTARAFAGAHLVVRGRFANQRVVAAQLEPRAAVARHDEAHGVTTLFYGTQGVLRHRNEIVAALGLAPGAVDVVSGDVGGAFGSRSHTNPEAVLVTWAARRLRRSVRWVGDRIESFLSDFTGRDMSVEAELAFDAGGRILALRETATCTIGAYTVSYSSPQNFVRIAPSVYDVPVALVRVVGVLTNTIPTTSYRGAGRPEANLSLERLLDLAALRLDIDRVEIRRRNLVRTDALPYTTATGLTYDSGDFEGNMDRTLELAAWNGRDQRAAESERRGRLRGFGVANYIESPVGNPREQVRLRVLPEGVAEVVIGTQSSGQGHETVFAQVVAEYLGLPLDAVRVVTGDTRVVAAGGGTQSNRSMRLGGTLLAQACTDVLAQARGMLAESWGCAADHVAFAGGTFRHGDRTMTLFALAASCELAVTTNFNGRLPAFPTGCAVCELEVDPATGEVRLLRYTQVDDVGQAINPLIVHGQTHGGIAQGVGQALFEDLTPNDETGEPGATSFMTYAMPRAFHLPPMEVELAEHATLGNPLRVKGGGEGGVTPAPAAVIGAICDALRAYGVEHIDTPATPERVWTAIRAARVAVSA